MSDGQLQLTPDAIRVHLRRILRKTRNLTPEERYALKAAGDAVMIVERLSKHLDKADAAIKKIRTESQG